MDSGKADDREPGGAFWPPPREGGEPRERAYSRPPKIDPAHSFTTIQKNKGAHRDYISYIQRMNTLFSRVSDGLDVNSRAVNHISTQLLQSLRDQRGQYLGFVLGGEVREHEMAKSAVNIAILSALTAQELKLPSHKIFYVTISALLHDAGMFRLPKKITGKKGPLTDAERMQVRGHPLLSREIAMHELSYPDEVGDMVLQHHERWDGNGYPNRMAGDAISIGARIISVADSFEAMVSPRPYRGSVAGYQASKSVLADNLRRFDPDILKVFILNVGVYPVGSIVRLSTGAVARVSETQPATPLRPKVQILVDEQGRVLANEDASFVDLAAAKRVYIARAIEPQELQEIYECPPPS